jgi:hypothetical protein
MRWFCLNGGQKSNLTTTFFKYISSSRKRSDANKVCLEAGRKEKSSGNRIIADETDTPSKGDEIVLPSENKAIPDQSVDNGQMDQPMLIDKSSSENCAEKISKEGDEKVTTNGNNTYKQIGQNGQIAQRSKSSPNS